MPHANGKIYIDTSTTPPTGINIQSDIAAVLGVVSDYVDDIFLLSDVNKWAKYKGSPYPGCILTGKTSGSPYWRGTDGKCGLSIQEYSEFGSPSNSNSFAYKLLNNQLTWNYVRPNGSTFPYRPLDFDGYDDNCIAPMEPLTVFNYMVRSDGTLQIDFDYVQIQDQDNLKLSDILVNGTALSSWYFGILVYDNSSHYEFFTSQNPISDGNLSVVFSSMVDYAGKTVQVVPFLSSVSMTTQSTATAGGYYVSFNIAPASCTLVAASSGIDAYINEATWNAAGTVVSYVIELVNNNASAFTLQNIRIALWEDSAPTGTLEASRDISSITVQVGSSEYITGTFSFNKDSSKDYFVSIATVGNNVIPFDYIQTEEEESPSEQ